MITEDKVRIQFDLPKKKVNDLDRLMKEGGIETRRELFNNALSLLEWAIKQRKGGRTIASINENENTYRELDMPILGNVDVQHTAGR